MKKYQIKFTDKNSNLKVVDIRCEQRELNSCLNKLFNDEGLVSGDRYSISEL